MYLCIYRSIYLSIDRSIYLSIYLSRYLSIHRAVSLSIYLSIDLAPRASSFFSMQKNDGCRSAHGIIFLRRQTVVRWVRKKHNDARDNFGTCCRVRSAARKNTRFIQSGAAKPAPVLCALEKNCDAESGRRTDGPEETPSTVAPWVRKKKHHSRDNFGSNTGTCCRVRSAARRNTRFIQSGAAKPAPRLCAWRNTATQKADAAPMGQKKHHPCGVRTRSPATTRSPAKRSNWIAAMHLLKAKTICFHCPETSLSQFHFGMLPLRVMVFTVFPESRRYARRSFSASVRIRMGHVLCSCKIFRTKIASAATRCFLKHSHSATLSPRASSKSIAFSGGGSVLVRHRCVEAALREHARQRLQSQAPVLHFSGAMPAGSCLFAMAVTVAGRKTTPPERGCLQFPCFVMLVRRVVYVTWDRTMRSIVQNHENHALSRKIKGPDNPTCYQLL